MPKINALAQALKRQQAANAGKKPAPLPVFKRTAVAGTAKTATAGVAPVPPSRAGRVLIAGHFAPQVQTALKIAAAEERTTVQALLAEGINAVFARRGKPEIAAITARKPESGSMRNRTFDR